MRTDNPVVIQRRDYLAPVFWIDTVLLHFELDAVATRITTELHCRRNGTQAADWVLNGVGLALESVRVDGVALPADRYSVTPETLTLSGLPDQCVITTVVKVNPTANTELSGLYSSNGRLYTQCEAEGFRRITYSLDRPDVMSRYTVRLTALPADYPILLSNGNLLQEETLADGRISAVWVDPHPKPSYLFALVAGHLVVNERRITTNTGAPALLQVWVEPGDLPRTDYTLDSLEASIRWDQARYGLELDLERFMIVAVSDFNMGAMENKGLNLFNAKFVLASPDTATDDDYSLIEAIVGHEYFHNWTGNRVTCRDWFQLTLKEGLTVFRDQEFSMDQMSDGGKNGSARAVKRISDVRDLRLMQFAEDAGPMAHPIRPERYEKIDNFYTATVYEKGAEVIRMMQTLVGLDGFRRGMDLYFARHDGQAVTCDDFRAAMADANRAHAADAKQHAAQFAQFERWYTQAGTPRVAVQTAYDAAAQRYTLTFTQHAAANAPVDQREPFVIPMALALLGKRGDALALSLEGAALTASAAPSSTVIVLTEAVTQVTFTGVLEQPVPSLLRDFSAPVILDYGTVAENAFLLQHDTDPFNRYEAGQRWMLAVLRAAYDAHYDAHYDTNPDRELSRVKLPEALLEACRSLLTDPQLDPAFKSLALTWPSERALADLIPLADPLRIHHVRQLAVVSLGTALFSEWQQHYHQLTDTTPYQPHFAASGRRALRNLALEYAAAADPQWLARAGQQYQLAGNMTDRFAALECLVNHRAHAPELADQALADFETHFANDAVVFDKWFRVQATAHAQAGQLRPVERVRELAQHARFALTNPNRARSLVHAFCTDNPAAFHATDGSGYAFWAEQLLAIDQLNPQLASRLARAMARWRSFDRARSERMRAALQGVAQANLSPDTAEVIRLALADEPAQPC